MKRLAIWLALCVMCAVAAAQTQTSGSQSSPSSSSSTSPSPTKPKKVYTEDDLSQMSGGISVVGEATKAPAKKKPAAKNPEQANPEEPAEEEEDDSAMQNRPKCESLAWGMTVDTVLRQQGVRMDRNLWVQKAYGGDICTASLGSMDNLARSVTGDYSLDDGSKVHIDAKLFPGLPSSAAFVESVRGGRPWILILGGHPWLIELLSVINYDNGAAYDIREIKLTDPYYGRRMTFTVGKQDPKEIEAVVEVTVVKR